LDKARVNAHFEGHMFQARIAIAAAVLFLMAAGTPAAQAACELKSADGRIKRVVYILFDNVHLRRDNPNVPSDLEQMPHLLNFLTQNGTISDNHHTALISHTGTNILTGLTGLYGDRMGVPIANSFGYFRPDGSVGVSSAFGYWTSLSDDGMPLMLGENGKTAPAPWVPFTRAGCDVGVFSMANMALQNLTGDMVRVFGADSAEAREAASNEPAAKAKAAADYLGIALHCGAGSALCGEKGLPDLLPDEPGGYDGFKALYGNKYVQPVISPGGPVKDISGNVLADERGNPGYPNRFNPTAAHTLGYAATMLEAGVPVVYAYIADAHDPNPVPAAGGHAYGPGEEGYVRQLAAYNDAFGKFLARLEAGGINRDNTLFVVVADENDHFAGGPPSPPDCDGIRVPCTYAKIGEINTHLDRLLTTERKNNTPFGVHADVAPTVYIHGNPGPLDPVTRAMQKDVSQLTATSPITGKPDKLTVAIADRALMKLLHMVTASPARTPSFTVFGHPDYYLMTSGNRVDCGQQPDCVHAAPEHAWSHGGFQPEMSRTWMAMAGPGVRRLGRDDAVFSDHTDLRPTLLALAGLKDSYVHDGRVLTEKVEDQALPEGLRASRAAFEKLADAYKRLNAPLGELGRISLSQYGTLYIATGDAAYAQHVESLTEWTAERDKLAGEIKAVLDGAVFQGRPLDSAQTESLLRRMDVELPRDGAGFRNPMGASTKF
jgi:hypothetical protein